MELADIGSVLRRHRILVAVGALLAVLAAAQLSGAIANVRGAAGAPPAGQALIQVQVDTRSPLAATVGLDAAETIAQRTVLLADLMGKDSTVAAIAHQAGVAAGGLYVQTPVLLPVSEFQTLPNGELATVVAAATQTVAGATDVVHLVPNPTLPIITVGTSAPNARTAVALANATVAALRAATIPSSTAAPGGRQATAPAALIIRPLGVVRSVAIAAHTLHLAIGLAALLAVFVFWCIGVLFASGLARLWRSGAVAAAV